MAVIGRVGGVVGRGAIVIGEAHEARVLDAVALVGRHRKDDAFAHGELGREAHLVVGVGEPLDASERVGEALSDRLRPLPDAEYAPIQLASRERIAEGPHDGLGCSVVEPHLVQLHDEL
jgi:hypothetical protein